MKNTLFALSMSALLYSCAQSSGTQNSETEPVRIENTEAIKSLWTTGGFVHPESVILSQDSSFLYVSNIGNDESKESPDGFISKVSLNGEILDLRWVDKIRSPKGLSLANGKLYVSAVTELIEIETSTGKVLNKYTSPDVEFLNDVATDQDGNVYVSGMFESAIYKLDPQGKFEKIYQNNELDHPNGLLVVGNDLYIGGWGRVDDSKVEEDSVGYFFKLSLNDKVLKKVTSDKPGKLDGIQIFGDKFLVSSWKEGAVLLIDKDGKYSSVIDTETSLGDILYLQDKKMIFLPMNFQNQVKAVSFN